MSGHSSLHRAALTLVTSVLVPTMLAAQASTRPTFGVSGGASFPTSDFGDAVNTGYNIGAHIGFKPALSPVGLRVEGMYNQFDFKSPLSDLKAKILAGTANVVVMSAAAPGAIRPYFIGGLGVYNLKVSGDDALAGDNASRTKFGLNGGAGIDLALSGINVFLEARYHHVFTKDTENDVTTNTGFVPVVVGVRF